MNIITLLIIALNLNESIFNHILLVPICFGIIYQSRGNIIAGEPFIDKSPEQGRNQRKVSQDDENSCQTNFTALFYPVRY